MAIKTMLKKFLLTYFNNKKQKGFALIFVLVFVAMIMGVVGDIVYQTQVGARGSIEERNGLDAQTTALTGIEFAKLMLTLSSMAAKYQNNPLIPLPKNMYNMLNGQPIGASGLQKLEELSGANLSKVIAPSIQKALKAVPGYFVLNISSENAKLNLNLLQSNFSSDTQKALLRIFSTQDSQKFIESMGYTPQQLVDNLTSYIKISVTNAYLQNSTQGDYDKIGAKYQPKHAPLETLEELRRIPGFNVDDIYNMYTPYFTIWPISAKSNSLNVNIAPTELLATLMTPNGQDVQDQVWDRFEDYLDKNTLDKNKLNDWFQKNFPGFKDDTDSAGIVKNILGDSDSIFKVESRGVVNGVEKTLVVVFQQGGASTNNSNSNNNQQNNNNQGNNSNNQQNNNNQGNNNNQQNKNQQNQNSNKTPSFQIIYSAWK